MWKRVNSLWNYYIIVDLRLEKDQVEFYKDLHKETLGKTSINKCVFDIYTIRKGTLWDNYIILYDQVKLYVLLYYIGYYPNKLEFLVCFRSNSKLLDVI